MDLTSKDKLQQNTVLCALCRADITYAPKRYQLTSNYGVICSRCRNRFTEKDLIIISDLFFIYGGYFGKLPRRSFDLLSQLIAILEDHK